jgi:NADH-quinone oxidoreductase subunit C
VPLGGDDVLFDKAMLGPAVEDISMPHAGESFEGKTGSEEISGR